MVGLQEGGLSEVACVMPWYAVREEPVRSQVCLLVTNTPRIGLTSEIEIRSQGVRLSLSFGLNFSLSVDLDQIVGADAIADGRH